MSQNPFQNNPQFPQQPYPQQNQPQQQLPWQNPSMQPQGSMGPVNQVQPIVQQNPYDQTLNPQPFQANIPQQYPQQPQQPVGYGQPPQYQGNPQAQYPQQPYGYGQQPVNIVIQNSQYAYPGGSSPYAPVRIHNRNKYVAAALAWFLGAYGGHKFYLGQTSKGILYLAFFWTLIPLIISFVEAIILLTMSEQEFDMKYNMGMLPMQR